jgi:thiamine biosynthesis lipoprotein
MTATATELRETFACFGGECTVIVAGEPGGERDAAASLRLARRALLGWHGQFTRFDARSELSLLNADPRSTVPVSPMMRRVVDAALLAARQTGGLVDPTLVEEIERAGYATDVAQAPSLAAALEAAPPRGPAMAHERARWTAIATDRRAGTVTRPAGTKLDGGGIAKGVFADELAAALGRHGAFVVDCCGDLRLGGTDGAIREVHVESPFDGSVIHTFELAGGGVATSGIGRRAWIGPDGAPAHHLLNPASGGPAFTGVVQVTALAPTATEAETRSKAALLSGPAGATQWLPHGGVVVLDDGSHVSV